jgi:hypothetical protein
MSITKYEQYQNQDSSQAAPRYFGHALSEGLPVIKTNTNILQNLETSQHNGKERGLQQCRVDEWCIVVARLDGDLLRPARLSRVPAH